MNKLLETSLNFPQTGTIPVPARNYNMRWTTAPAGPQPIPSLSAMF